MGCVGERTQKVLPRHLTLGSKEAALNGRAVRRAGRQAGSGAQALHCESKRRVYTRAAQARKSPTRRSFSHCRWSECASCSSRRWRRELLQEVAAQ